MRQLFLLVVIVGLSGCNMGFELEPPTDVAQAAEKQQPSPTPEPSPTIVLMPEPQTNRNPLDPEQQMGLLPDGILAYYSPDGQIYGQLPTGEPYHVIGRRGNSWLYIRLPYLGQFWIVRAQLPKAEAQWAPEY